MLMLFQLLVQRLNIQFVTNKETTVPSTGNATTILNASGAPRIRARIDTGRRSGTGCARIVRGQAREGSGHSPRHSPPK